MQGSELRQQVTKLKLEYPSWGRMKIAKKLNCSPSKVRKILSEIKKEGTQGKKEVLREYHKNTGVVTVKSLGIRTLEDALKVAEVDLGAWDVDRYVVNSWEATIGAKSSSTGKPETYTNFQVKIWLKKKIKEPLQTALENVVERIKVYAPKYTTIKRKKYDRPCLLEVSLYDHHFGMLAWRKETRQDYDIKIAEMFYLEAVKDLLERTGSFNVEKILFPIGQDFFHLNDPTMSTPKGSNRLDVDCRFAKVFEAGKMAVIKAIDLCRKVAPVDVLWVPGNHDPESSYYLSQILWALHYKDSEVNVNIAPNVRKHYAYGVNFVGFTHGDEEPWRDLPRIFMDEYSKDWAGTKYREIHVGHRHKKKKTDFISMDSFGGTAIRMIPSLCSTDAWHYLKGYIGSDRAAEAFLWHKEDGLIGSFLTHVPGLKLKGEKR